MFIRSLLFLALFAARVDGFVGATEAECRNLYGEYLSESKLEGCDKALAFRRDGILILAGFSDGKVVTIGYMRQNLPGKPALELSQEDIQQLLTGNGAGEKWTEERLPSARAWKRADGKVSAYYILATKRLTIFTTEHEKRMEKAMKR